MELRTRGDMHFIQTIRCGLVTKVRSTDFHRLRATKSKSLKEVYVNEDAIRLQKSTPGSLFGRIQVKLEVPCPLVDRTLEEIMPKTEKLICNDVDDEDSDLDDLTTLKQLKEQFLAKKRKYIHSFENFNQDDANDNPVEDEFDQPLINFKPKRLKTSKSKKKGTSQVVVSSSTIDPPTEHGGGLFSKEGSLEVGHVFGSLTNGRIEVPEPDLEWKNKALSADDSFVTQNEGDDLGVLAANESGEAIRPEFIEPIVSAQEQQTYLTNEVSYDRLEDSVPISKSCPCDGKVKPESVQELLDSPPLVIETQKENTEAYSCDASMYEDPNSDICSSSRCSSSMDQISGDLGQTSSYEIQISDITTEDTVDCLNQEVKAETDFVYEQEDSVSAQDKTIISFSDSVDSSLTREKVVSIEETVAVDEQQPSTHSVSVIYPEEAIAAEQTSAHSGRAILKNDLHCEPHIEDKSLKHDDMQTSASSIADAESQSLDDRSCDGSGTLSTSELCQPPERLLSRRKVISPSSQEILCNAMKSAEICNDANQSSVPEYKEKQTVKKALAAGLDTQHDALTANHTESEQASPQKVIISPKNITKRNFKGNLEGPHFSRTLPKLNTGSISIEGCSESAIAFSQRQMHDMESLASKLMTELKSLKDMVEQKLLFEAYRNASLRNDADGVKSVIKNATKVEDNARKWLSMMSRDCNRFCKLMEMTPSSSAPSKQSSPRRERKKITFADEVGGELCHVKLFGDGDFSNDHGVEQ